MSDTTSDWKSLCEADSKSAAFAEHFSPFATTEAGKTMLADHAERVDSMSVEGSGQGAKLVVTFWTGTDREKGVTARWICSQPFQGSLEGLSASHRNCLELHNGIAHSWEEYESLSPIQLCGFDGKQDPAQAFHVEGELAPLDLAPEDKKLLLDELGAAMEETIEWASANGLVGNDTLMELLMSEQLSEEELREALSNDRVLPFLDPQRFGFEAIDDIEPAFEGRTGDRYYLVPAARNEQGEPGVSAFGHDGEGLAWPYRPELGVGDFFLVLTGRDIVRGGEYGRDKASELYWLPFD